MHHREPRMCCERASNQIPRGGEVRMTAASDIGAEADPIRIQPCIIPRVARDRNAPGYALLVCTKCKHYPVGVTRSDADDTLAARGHLDRNLGGPFGDPADTTGSRSIGKLQLLHRRRNADGDIEV